MALPAAIIFVISIVVLLAQIPYRNTQYEKHVENLQNHKDSLTQRYQKYLSETAQKITQLPVEQQLISDIQSKFLRESQQTNLFLWIFCITMNKGIG